MVFSFWGIHEFDVTMTDFLLGSVCLVLSYRLKELSKNKTAKIFMYFFFLNGLVAFLGGAYHGFFTEKP